MFVVWCEVERILWQVEWCDNTMRLRHKETCDPSFEAILKQMLQEPCDSLHHVPAWSAHVYTWTVLSFESVLLCNILNKQISDSEAWVFGPGNRRKTRRGIYPFSISRNVENLKFLDLSRKRFQSTNVLASPKCLVVIIHAGMQISTFSLQTYTFSPQTKAKVKASFTPSMQLGGFNPTSVDITTA